MDLGEVLAKLRFLENGSRFLNFFYELLRPGQIVVDSIDVEVD